MLKFKTLSITLKTLFAVLFLLFAAIADLSAQKTELASSASLEHCRNGSASSPAGCTAVGGDTGWVTGNAGSSNSHWAETQFIAYRMLFSGLSNGTHTVTIGYDILKSGKHAIDYLGTYNATETTAIRASGSAVAAARRRAPLRFQLIT